MQHSIKIIFLLEDELSFYLLFHQPALAHVLWQHVKLHPKLL